MSDDQLFDAEALGEIVRRAEDALRPLGLTLQHEGVVAAVTPDGDMMVNLPCLIRPSAKKKLVEDREAKEQFNQMMAQQHEATIQKKLESLREVVKNVDALFDEDECLHENRHPEGFCLDCGEGLQ